MTSSRKAPTKKPSAKLRPPKRSAQREPALSNTAGATRTGEHELQRRSAVIAHKTQIALEKALPNVDTETIGSFVANIDSIWDTGQKLDRELNRLFRMQFPRDREQLREFFSFVEAIQIEMTLFWIGKLKRTVPALRDALRGHEIE